MPPVELADVLSSWALPAFSEAVRADANAQRARDEFEQFRQLAEKLKNGKR